MAMRREQVKDLSKDPMNLAHRRVVSNRRTSISCTRLTPTPQCDINEMKKLWSNSIVTEPELTRNRVPSPDLDSSMQLFQSKKSNGFYLERHSAMCGSMKTGKELRTKSEQKESNGWFRPLRWIRKIKASHPMKRLQSINVSRRNRHKVEDKFITTEDSEEYCWEN